MKQKKSNNVAVPTDYRAERKADREFQMQMKAEEARKNGKPLKKTPKQIEEYVDSLNNEEVRRYYWRNEVVDKPVVLQIIELSRRIQRHDSNFENKTSEIPKAKEVAKEMIADFKKLVELIAKVEEHEAAIVMECLRVMDYMYLRVLGDQLTVKDEETGVYVNWEDKIKSLWHCEELKYKHERWLLKQFLIKKGIDRDRELTPGSLYELCHP